MSENEDIDALAAEYVLGTLDAGERAAVAARRNREPNLAATIEAWERRLGPLALAMPSVPAPAGLLAKIEERIQRHESERQGFAARIVPDAPLRPDLGGNVVMFESRIRRWRRAAIAASALAASLALVIGVREAKHPTDARTFVAVLQKDAASPAFLLTVDVETRQLTIRAVAPDPQPGKSYQLWLVNASLGAPRSLGLLPENGFSPTTALGGYDRSILESATYAVSLEPQGGSPTGAPTGPVLYAGKLVQATR